jgi:hypothetical protein
MQMPRSGGLEDGKEALGYLAFIDGTFLWEC